YFVTSSSETVSAFLASDSIPSTSSFPEARLKALNSTSPSKSASSLPIGFVAVPPGLPAPMARLLNLLGGSISLDELIVDEHLLFGILLLVTLPSGDFFTSPISCFIFVSSSSLIFTHSQSSSLAHPSRIRFHASALLAIPSTYLFPLRTSSSGFIPGNFSSCSRRFSFAILSAVSISFKYL
ncbi:hypothetical protein ADUPG1_005420, partial [Aduncisulcus paluster]